MASCNPADEAHQQLHGAWPLYQESGLQLKHGDEVEMPQNEDWLSAKVVKDHGNGWFDLLVADGRGQADVLGYTLRRPAAAGSTSGQ